MAARTLLWFARGETDLELVIGQAAAAFLRRGNGRAEWAYVHPSFLAEAVNPVLCWDERAKEQYPVTVVASSMILPGMVWLGNLPIRRD